MIDEDNLNISLMVQIDEVHWKRLCFPWGCLFLQFSVTLGKNSPKFMSIAEKYVLTANLFKIYRI